MSSKQERRAAKAKEAEAAFTASLERAHAATADNLGRMLEWVRPDDMSAEEWDVCCAVRVLREQAVAWWQIGHMLALPGSADNVREGKSGAGYARRLYERAFGDRPRARVGGGKAAAVERAEKVGPWFGGQTAVEVAAAVAGRKLTWIIKLGEVTSRDEAVVSSRGARPYGEDAITFHTAEYGGEPGKPKMWLPGPERTVRVASIIRVAPGLPERVRV